ncbi:DMT family transporter [Glutamicibacter protophormiae]|uniref:DMT family transporter n=1 Tax=Glutamicibacter protophormiae TaxID=37930 RepID=UPI002A7EA760|nr:DMT family transporter [Glutamicibacter protophormiae]WPR65668.1 DMT family transporter [Glutamicibacter protophormiae]WPR69165.1 DMT family transporter [Glutamicibacter protophormiae]
MTSRTTPPPVHAGGTLLFILLSAASGLLLSLQSRINGALATALGDPIAAAAFSFGVGLLALALTALAAPTARRGVRRIPAVLRGRRVPWWYLAAGAVGALIVFSQSATVPLIGVALFTVCLVTGQAIGSMAMDRVGFGGAAPRRISIPRIIGVALTIVGVIWSVDHGAAGTGLSGQLLPMGFAVLVGMLMGFQGAANGAQSAAYGSAIAATLVNFVVGFAVLGAVMLARLAGGARLAPLPAEPWYYIGGLLGCIFVGLTATVIKRLGVLVTSLAAVGGQLVGSLVLDIVVPAAGSRVSTATVLGTTLTLLAVALASVSGAHGTAAAVETRQKIRR